MEKDLFPWIGGLPIWQITAPLLLQTLRRIEDRGAHEGAHTLRQTAGQVFRYGVATGRCDRNPAPDPGWRAAADHRQAMSAVWSPGAASSLLRAIWKYEGQPLRALRLESLRPALSTPRGASGTWNGSGLRWTPRDGPFRRRR